jgi:hypothetical protein
MAARWRRPSTEADVDARVTVVRELGDPLAAAG